ncbi:glucose-1-phosphate adenylyltransferase [Mycoplasmatota bacterium]|nr:glucose-1-phosphate adenylyltransferase [Mycoplasmatota bacterium]
MNKKEMIAMLLAGGKGTRLVDLTKEIAKPAVYFGGKYRIIDFSLSNCTNSGIDTVGVLTQYEPLVLNSYIGNGKAWDLDVINGGVTVLPPYSSGREVQWYNGTASAVALNCKFIDYYEPSYVLILSGDHIYKMDYSKMLDYHMKNKADLTISVIEVPMSEASRFGIINTFENNLINEFEEKPKKPKSNLASMGIYIFNWSILKQFLMDDLKEINSTHDFGKDIIPKILASGLRCFAYPFKGYWKDVGTVKSFWDANMDLLDSKCDLNLYDNSWPVYSVSQHLPPHYINEVSDIDEVLVNKGCIVYGSVQKSLLFYQVYIDEDSVVRHSVVMPNARIEKGAILEYTIVQEGIVVPANTVIKGTKDNIILVSKVYLETLKQVGR